MSNDKTIRDKLAFSMLVLADVLLAFMSTICVGYVMMYILQHDTLTQTQLIKTPSLWGFGLLGMVSGLASCILFKFLTEEY